MEGAPPPAFAATKAAAEVAEVAEAVYGNGNPLVVRASVVDVTSAVAMKPSSGGGLARVQDFLETEPYWDQSTVPVNTHKGKSTFGGKVVSMKRIMGPKVTGKTGHTVINHKGDFPVSFCGAA